MEKIIEVERLYKTYMLGTVSVEVLKEINLSVKKGEFITIMGPSGSGKSTLLYLMGGLDKPTEGKIFIKNQDISALSDEEQSRKAESETAKTEVQMEYITQLKNKLKASEDKLNKAYIAGNQIVSQYENAAVYDISYEQGHITDISKKAFSIANLDSLIIEADVVEEFIKDIQVGARVRIVPAADRAREYEGSVKYISKMAFNNNGETIVPIRISIDNKDSFLLPNYNVDVYIEAP